MGEETGGPIPEIDKKKEQLKKAVESALEGREDSWKKEEKTPEFQEIKRDAAALRHKLYERHGYPGEKETPLVDMTYNAATRLTDALKELLQSPLHVANVPKMKGQSGFDKRFINHSRNGFINDIVEVLEQTNISLEDIKEVQERNAQT